MLGESNLALDQNMLGQVWKGHCTEKVSLKVEIEIRTLDEKKIPNLLSKFSKAPSSKFGSRLGNVGMGNAGKSSNPEGCAKTSSPAV